jgi:hypothetical protein
MIMPLLSLPNQTFFPVPLLDAVALPSFFAFSFGEPKNVYRMFFFVEFFGQ